MRRWFAVFAFLILTAALAYILLPFPGASRSPGDSKTTFGVAPFDSSPAVGGGLAQGRPAPQGKLLSSPNPPGTPPAPSSGSSARANRSPATGTTTPVLAADSGAQAPSAAPLLEEAHALAKAGQIERAAEIWRTIPEKAPGTPEAMTAHLELFRFSSDPLDRARALGALAESPGRPAELERLALECGRQLLAQGQEEAAWLALSAALRSSEFSPHDPELVLELRELAKRIFFNPMKRFSNSAVHVVRPGDSLAKIASQYRIELGLLRRINRLNRDVIFPGEKLKVVKGPVTICVSKSQRQLYVYLDGKFVRDFPVAVGTEEHPTPEGTFTVSTKKLHDPPWYRRDDAGGTEVIPPGDPRNILGSRWIGLEEDPQYGIHGTTDPAAINKQSSRGCVRMQNGDIEELYDLTPPGSRVEIRA